MPHPTPAVRGLLDPALVGPALRAAFVKLDPRHMVRNPVMMVTEVVAALATLLAVLGADGVDRSLLIQLAIWLWITVLFATFAEALAEGRGKARADSLRATQGETMALRLASPDATSGARVSSRALKRGDLVRAVAGEVIPADGEVIGGIAAVDESAITGESAPVIREAGGDRSAVTGGTRVVSDQLVIRVTQTPGDSFLDRMIAMVEGADRRRTPNEVALSILLTGLTLIFVLVCATLQPFAIFSGGAIPVAFLLALFVTLIPTTIGGLLSAIGIAGMDRLVKENVIAKSGRAVEAAGDVDTLLIDKTGTITLGNRMAEMFIPAPGIAAERLARVAREASMGDPTPEGTSVVALAERLGARDAVAQGTVIAFSAETRLSGLDLGQRRVRKGAVDSLGAWVRGQGGALPAAVQQAAAEVARTGGTPLAVAEGAEVLGIIHLKDIVKPGIKTRFAQLRRMGVRTVMITGDNPLTAAAIAAEAGVDDYLAEATPERKLELIRAEQAKGHMVAMCGDGANDAPALAQADVGVAMNDGTPAAKEAANLIDLDSDPTKLLAVVNVGKQLLISRGALTTFSLANDVAKYFAILPALFVGTYPGLAALNVMGLDSPGSAILSAVIFNALVIVALIPLALRGVAYRPASAAAMLRRNLAIYGLGGLIVPFVGIKLIDLAVTALGLA